MTTGQTLITSPSVESHRRSAYLRVHRNKFEATSTLGSKAARIALLAVVYVFLYYIFGRYVAWQNPELRLYYSGSTELKGFFEQVRSTCVVTPWMLPYQFARGLLWAAFAYPIARMAKTTRFETACTIAALFGIWGFVLLLPNPLMPASVAHSHFWETLWCDLLLGAIVGWVLAGTTHSQVDSSDELRSVPAEKMSEVQISRPLL